MNVELEYVDAEYQDTFTCEELVVMEPETGNP
jgi:hypothetical protein